MRIVAAKFPAIRATDHCATISSDIEDLACGWHRIETHLEYRHTGHGESDSEVSQANLHHELKQVGGMWAPRMFQLTFLVDGQSPGPHEQCQKAHRREDEEVAGSDSRTRYRRSILPPYS